MMNQSIKNGEWQDIFDVHLPLIASRILEDFNFYALDKVIVDHIRIELQYTTFIENIENTEVITLDNNANILHLLIRTIKTKTY